MSIPFSSTEGNGQADDRLGLAPAHLADLRKSGLSDAQIAACRFYSLIEPDKVSEVLKWKKSAKALVPCLAIPYFDPAGNELEYVRLKPSNPRVDRKTGKPIKYESPIGTSNRAYFPPRTRAVLNDPSVTLLFIEGEKKAAKGDQEGFACIGLAGVYGWTKKRRRGPNGKGLGAFELIPDLAAIVWQRRMVYIVYDSDAAENDNVRWAEWNLAEVLAAAGAVVRVVRLPAGPPGPDGKAAKVGLDDFIVAQGPTEFRNLLEGAGSAERPARRASGLPEIKVNTEEHRVNDEAIDALAKNAKNLYQRAGMLVHIVKDGGDVPGIRRPNAPHIERIPMACLRELLTSCVLFYKVTINDRDENEVPTHPPAWCVNAVHARGRWPGIRHLEAVVEYPVLLPDGTVLQTVGYHAQSGICLMPRGELPTIPENPTWKDAVAAAIRLAAVVDDFPFRSHADKSAWLAALLTPLARFAFEGPAPLFLCDANTRGAGKGLLLDLIALIVTGQQHTIMTYPKDEEELRKRITALVISGDRLVLLDNLTGNIGNGTLDAALTSTLWGDRVLGVNQQFKGPMLMTWYGTGNNVQIGADTARRVCHIRLETPEERPEDRKGFEIPDLLAHVREHRAELLVDALTILRAHAAAGRPQQDLKPWGSYQGWSKVVREAITWIEAEDPIKTTHLLREEADLPALAMKTFLLALRSVDPDKQGKTAHQLIDMAKQEENEQLRDAIESLAGRMDARMLGNKLRTFRRRIVGGLFLDRAGSDHRATRWTARDSNEFTHG